MTSLFEFDTDLDRLYLEIDPAHRDAAWAQSQRLATPASRWRAYLNQLAWQTLQSWLSEDFARPVRPMIAAALLPTIWEWVDGCGVSVGSPATGRDGQFRVVLVPTEALDDDELRVPQEWVDIPSWAGDYYVQLLVNPDDGWVKVAGTVTYATLREKAVLETGDRTYSLASEDLTPDINAISLAQTLAPASVTRSDRAPARELSAAEAQSLIQRLSPPALLDPRLAIDFDRWRSLMAHGGWRRQMSQQRWGQPRATFSVSRWLESGMSQLAEQIGWQPMTFQAAAGGARGDADEAPETCAARTLEIAGEAYGLQVSPLVGEVPNAWRFELRKLNGLVPPGTVLRLLSEDLQPFDNNEVSATEPTDALYVDVALAEGEGIVWQIEPEPDQYEFEMLRF